MTGSGGSGILIARKSDGTWSPPSGIMLHTPTLSFIIGVDIYDCVLVISNLAALESITRPRVTLGEDVGLENGPCVPLNGDEPRLSWKDLGNNVLAYMKARGQHQAVNLNGCILTERANENERFYSSDATQMDILAGNVARHVEETKPLFEVIKMAEGRTDFDKDIIDKTAIQPAPGDALIETPKGSTPVSPRFGVPKADDPDPFGILALEMAGLEIREAGSRARPSSSQVDPANGPMSPTLSKFSRQSLDTRSNRGSYMSTRTVKSQGTDGNTHIGTRNNQESSPAPRKSDESRSSANGESDEIDYTTVDMTPLRHISQDYADDTKLPGEDAAKAESRKSARRSPSPARTSEKETAAAKHDTKDSAKDVENDDDEGDDEGDDDEDDDEEPVVYEVAAVQPTRTQAVASRVIHARGNVVTIAKRVPPPLPRRSPARMSRVVSNEGSSEPPNVKSPLRQAFSEADLRDDDEAAQTASARADYVKSTGDMDEAVASSATQSASQQAESDVDQASEKKLVENGRRLSDPGVNATETIEQTSDVGPESLPEEPAAETARDQSVPVPPETAKDGDVREAALPASIDADYLTDDASEYLDAENEMDDDSSDEIGSEILEAEFSMMKPAAVVHVRKSTSSANSLSTKHLSNAIPHERFDLDQKPQESFNFSRRDSGPLVSQLLGLNGEEDDSQPGTPHNEQTDVSDSASNTKHSSSIYTGITDDRWSYDGSSPTTPTSERPSSMSGDLTDGTPKKKGAKDADEVDDLSSESGGITPTTTAVA